MILKNKKAERKINILNYFAITDLKRNPNTAVQSKGANCRKSSQLKQTEIRKKKKKTEN